MAPAEDFPLHLGWSCRPLGATLVILALHQGQDGVKIPEEVFHDTDQREIPDFTTADFQDTWAVATIPLADTIILSQQGRVEVGARSPPREFSVLRGVAWLVFSWIF